MRQQPVGPDLPGEADRLGAARQHGLGTDVDVVPGHRPDGRHGADAAGVDERTAAGHVADGYVGVEAADGLDETRGGPGMQPVGVV